jgi:dTDP-4-dehydrorhamnose reductase
VEHVPSSNMKILILGKGYIGNYLAKANEKHKIFHISKSDFDYSNYENFIKFLQKESYYPKSQFDWIINCSGYTGKPNVEGCETDKENCYHYNVTVPLYLTKVANYFKIPIIHIGSGCIYDGYPKNGFTENDLPDFGADSPRSSFYSKTKDTFEKLSAHLDRYIFRIRIPFNGVVESKNYLWKLLKYDNLISQQNSITNVDDLVNFVYKFIEEQRPLGVYNVTNKGSIEAKEVVEILKSYGLENPNWNFVSIPDAKFKVGRSNCILNTDKIENLDLGLPPVKESIEKAIKQYSMAEPIDYRLSLHHKI